MVSFSSSVKAKLRYCCHALRGRFGALKLGLTRFRIRPTLSRSNTDEHG